MMEKMDGMSMDIEAKEREKLRAMFPQCFSEGRLDVDKLLSLCGEYITDDFEKYEFRWKGKSECLQLAGKRSTGTLRPCPEESVNFAETKNLYIEGDNLEVLKLLQSSYYRRVKMIYIDPPYNTGNDFVYADDFADPIAKYKEVTKQTTKSNPETMGRFHTNWLNMMYPRLRLAANLLRDDGVIFISIDDGEQVNLRRICDEVFGEENFVANIVWQKRYSPANDHKTICPMHDFILVYQKTDQWQRNLMPRSAENDKQYRYEDEKGIFRPDNYKCNKTAEERPNLYYPIINPNTGEEIWPSRDAVWRYSPERHAENIHNDMIFWGKDGKSSTPAFKRYRDMLRGGGGVVPTTWWPYEFAGHNDGAAKETAGLIGNRIFSSPKPTCLIMKLLQLATSADSNDIILDFFSGSATTAHAMMQLNAEDGGNRRFILVQLPELTDEKSEAYKAGYRNICEIGKERLRRAGQKIESEKLCAAGERDGASPSPTRSPFSSNNVNVDVGTGLAPVRTTTTATPDAGERDGASPSPTDYARAIATATPDGERDGASPSPTEMAAISGIDIGFRVFMLDSSNLKIWDDTPITGEDAAQRLEARLWNYLDVLVPDRTDVDMVYEVMLKLGQDLCEPIVEIPLAPSHENAHEAGQGQALSLHPPRVVYGVGEDVKFIVCLATGITPEDASAMADYAPGRIVFAEQCFASSTDKSNVRLTLKDKGIAIKTL